MAPEELLSVIGIIKNVLLLLFGEGASKIAEEFNRCPDPWLVLVSWRFDVKNIFSRT